MRSRISVVAIVAVLQLMSRGATQTSPPAQPPPATPKLEQPATPPEKPKPAAQKPQTARLSITLLVTDMQGKPLEGVRGKATGPVDREAASDAGGAIVFANVSAGSYRLRFEHESTITLERDVTVAGGRPLKAAVSLNAAPPPPEPPKPEPAAAPAPAAPPAPSGNFSPAHVGLSDFIEKNYVGNAPSKRSELGCTASSTSTLVQLREPLAEHSTPDADELIWVVAGEGTQKISGREMPLSAATFVVVPRGTPYSITRRGSRPLIFVSTLTGPPCASK